MKPENILIRLFKKLKCKLGLHNWVTNEDNKTYCWECWKEKEQQ